MTPTLTIMIVTVRFSLMKLLNIQLQYFGEIPEQFLETRCNVRVPLVDLQQYMIEHC